jgi:hypothetical protein
MGMMEENSKIKRQQGIRASGNQDAGYQEPGDQEKRK